MPSRAIVTINFNRADFYQDQVDGIECFSGETPDFWVGDNCTDEKQSDLIRGAIQAPWQKYIRINQREGDPSRSHAHALNLVISRLPDYEQVLIIDHDFFPYKVIDCFDRHRGCDVAGIHQIKDGGISYLGPMFFLINNFTQKREHINFMPCMHLDTGGSMKDWLQTQNVVHVNEQLQDNENYSIVDDGWMHFIKGSNWHGDSNHESRIEALRKKLDELISINL